MRYKQDKFVDRCRHNYGIDLLRVLATLFVLLIHIAPPIETVEMSSTYIGQKFLVALVDVCINLFGLISGYLCWNKKVQLKKIINLYMTVLFYSVIGTIIAYFFVKVPISDFIYSFIPLLSVRYWYFSAYIAMCVLIPFMNLAINQLDKRKGIEIILGLLFAFTVLTFLKDGNYDGIAIRYGYSTMWLCVLYICGGVIAKFNLNNIISKRKWTFIGLMCWFITALWLIILTVILSGQTRAWVSTFLLRYSSPTVMIMGVCFLMVFCDIHIESKIVRRVITFLSSTSFGVYILGRHWAIMEYIIESEVFSVLKNVNGLIFILSCTFSGFILYLIFATIEYVRQFVFKIAHCDKVSVVIEKVINRWIDFIVGCCTNGKEK